MGSRSVSFTVVCFEETCEILFEALVSPKNAFGDEADEDEAAASASASRQLLWCLQRRELMDEDSARVVSTAVPCVLRAMDYPSDVVKTTGARCAREMTRRCELDWPRRAPARRCSRRSRGSGRMYRGRVAARVGRRVCAHA